MSIDRLLTFAGEDVQNPDQQFSLETNILDIQLPDDGRDRFVRWSGEVFTEGPFKSQVELWLGGAGPNGARWARSNVALYEPGWSPTAGDLYVPGTAPRRVEVRLRSYDEGANAEARDFRLDALDVSELETFDHDTQGHADDSGEQVLVAGQSETVASLDIDLPDEVLARITGSLEVNPIGDGATFVQLFGDGHLLQAVPVAGPPGMFLSVSPMLVNLTQAGVREWELRVASSTGCRLRRPHLAMCDWGEVTG